MEEKIEELDEQKEIEADFTELDSKEADGLYRVLRPFRMAVRKGPLVDVPAGSIVRLTKQLATDLFFANKVEPLDLEGEREYEAIRTFTYTNAEGCYERIEAGTRLALMEQEALIYLKKGEVKPAFEMPMFAAKGGGQ